MLPASEQGFSCMLVPDTLLQPSSMQGSSLLHGVDQGRITDCTTVQT